MDYTPYLEVARDAARRAGSLLIQRHDAQHEVRGKTRFDFVTEMDELSEATIRAILLEAFPDHCILGEEEVARSGKDEAEFLRELDARQYLWVIDALDGTTNYIRGLPHFCISIALVHENQLCVGVVYDPTADELFSACRNQGAWLNEAPIRVSEASSPDCSILGMGFPAAELDKRRATMAALKHVEMDFVSLRVFNCAALLLCYVACGRLDASFEMGIHLWDMAGGVLIVREAGGSVTRFDGSDFDLLSRDNLSTNGRYHRALCERLNGR